MADIVVSGLGVVSRRALEARVRRRLAREGETLHRCRGGGWGRHDMGDYYTTNARSSPVRTHLDLEEVAREFHLLAPNEVVAAE